MSVEATSLETVLHGSPSAAEAEDATHVEASAAPVAEKQATGEVAAPPAAEKTPEKPPARHVPIEALDEERRRRRESDSNIRQLRQELDALKAPKPQRVELLDDPDKWEQQLDERVQSEVQKVRQESRAQLINMLEAQFRPGHADYDDAVSAFSQVAVDNPALIEEASRAANPVEYVYTAGKRLRMLNEAGDLDALLERERAKAREEGRQAALAERAALPAVPESLTEITGAKADTQKTWAPKPLNQLIINSR